MDKIRIIRLSKAFGKETVLRDFSLTISEGEIITLMGPSGCGKTTLLRILMGLEKPDSGHIEGMPSSLSVMFQEDRLLADFDAVANLRFVLGKQYSKESLAAELDALGLSDGKEKPLRQYSGGMARRVALCRCLLMESECIILDEPFKGLDTDTRELAIRYVMNRRRGRTLLMVTHSEEEAALMGGTILRLQ